MSSLQIALLSAYALGMSAGQLLFKAAAVSIQAEAARSTFGWLMRVPMNPYFVAAAVMYLALSVCWVWLLGFTPLSRAYPFVALAFVLTPLLGHFVFGEVLTARFFVGTGFVIIGLMLIVR